MSISLVKGSCQLTHHFPAILIALICRIREILYNRISINVFNKKTEVICITFIENKYNSFINISDI